MDRTIKPDQGLEGGPFLETAADDRSARPGLSVMPSGPDLAPANGDIVPYKEAKDRLIETYRTHQPHGLDAPDP